MSNSGFRISRPGPLAGQLCLGGESWANRSIAKRQATLRDTPQGDVAQAAATIDLELPAAVSPTKLKLVAELVAGEKRFANDWTAWLYPAVTKPRRAGGARFRRAGSACQAAAMGHQTLAGRRRVGRSGGIRNSPLRRSPAWSTCSNAAAAWWPSTAWTTRLNFRNVAYGTSWWKGSDFSQANYTGTLVYDHPVTRAMAPQRLVRRGLELSARRGRETLSWKRRRRGRK